MESYGIPEGSDIIGPDSDVRFEMRSPDDYPELPDEVKKAEIQFILPMANHLAHVLGINVIDEKMYRKILDQLKQRSLFVMMNLHRCVVREGFAEWQSSIIMTKKTMIVLPTFKLQLSTGRVGIINARFWEKANQSYTIIGDKDGRKSIPREVMTTHILNYFNHEGVVNI